MNAVKYLCKISELKMYWVKCPKRLKKPDEKCRGCTYAEMLG